MSKEIWDHLIKSGMTPAGAAGMMGNLHAESGLIANRVEILCLKRLKEHGRRTPRSSMTGRSARKSSYTRCLESSTGTASRNGQAQEGSRDYTTSARAARSRSRI